MAGEELVGRGWDHPSLPEACVDDLQPGGPDGGDLHRGLRLRRVRRKIVFAGDGDPGPAEPAGGQPPAGKSWPRSKTRSGWAEVTPIRCPSTLRFRGRSRSRWRKGRATSAAGATTRRPAP